MLVSDRPEVLAIPFHFTELAPTEIAAQEEEVRKDKMGGGDHGHVDASHGHGGDFRAKVWSMPGGPYCRPKHWKRNTAIAMTGIFLACIPIAMLSAKLEQRPHKPVRPIPSQLWCKNFGDKEL